MVSSLVTGGRETIAIRVPNHPILSEILEELQTGLVAPSANPHKGLSPTTADHVLEGLGNVIPGVVDGGKCTYGLESTLVDCTGKIPRILRPGPISAKEIEGGLGKPLQKDNGEDVVAPGQMKVHYQPKTPLILLSDVEIIQWVVDNPGCAQGCAFVLRTVDLEISLEKRRLPKDPQRYGQKLYETLHALDKKRAQKIVVETPPQTPEWSAIEDRLKKASFPPH